MKQAILPLLYGVSFAIYSPMDFERDSSPAVGSGAQAASPASIVGGSSPPRLPTLARLAEFARLTEPTGNLPPDPRAFPPDLAAFDVVPPVYLVPPDYPVRGMSRTEAGLVLDRELVKLAGVDHRCRVVQARLARRLIAQQSWKAHGFVRLSDFARERLGCSHRTLEEDARVWKSLDSLARIRGALEAGIVSWTQARLLTRIATPALEAQLLERAAVLSSRQLEEFLKEWDPSDALESDDEATTDHAASKKEESARSIGNSPESSALTDGAEESSAGPDASSTSPAITVRGDEACEPNVRWSTAVSPVGKRLWRSACEVASRVAGSPLSSSQVLELIVAEAASGDPSGADPDAWMPSDESMRRRLLEPGRRDEEMRRRALEAFREMAGVTEGFEWLEPVSREPGPAERLDLLSESLEDIDAFELERRLREVRRVAQRIDYQLGALVRIGSDRRLFREVGFATVKLYVESRLGMSVSRIWSLVAIERESWRRGGALRSAWREGRISPLAAATLLPVIGETHGEAWIRRAGEVTLRRLTDEVAWALDHGERESLSARPAPPPRDASIPPGGLSSVDLHEVEMRAHGESAFDQFGPRGSARLAFQLPISVAVLLEMQIRRYRHRRDPSWRAFERLVAHALLEWTAAPKHRDPVFERDGWRCAAPGCTSRRNLHDHHVVFRSHGGDNARDNRITLCAAHHLHGIHAGIIRVEGRAPDALLWTMPFVRLLGDRYLEVPHRDENCPTLH